jgi:SpoIID/LytB domain protein
LREYLYRLQEEPDTWPAQGLRVLVVAARTYVLSCIARGKHATDGYDICPYGSCCQAFNEQINPATRPNIVAAVNATAGEIITYNGQPIIAAYDTCCGGYTAGPEEAWGGSPVPYLRPVPDDACAPDEDHDWRVTMSWEDLQNRLNSRPETAVGVLYGVEVLSRWTSGRVKEIRVFGSGGSKVVSGKLFASIVGLQTHFFYIAAQNFDEYLLLQNPGEESAECLITYMLSDGNTLQEGCIVEPHSRQTLKVNDRVQNAEVSIKVSSNVPVVAERPCISISWASGGRAATLPWGSRNPGRGGISRRGIRWAVSTPSSWYRTRIRSTPRTSRCPFWATTERWMSCTTPWLPPPA